MNNCYEYVCTLEPKVLGVRHSRSHLMVYGDTRPLIKCFSVLAVVQSADEVQKLEDVETKHLH